MTGSLQARAGTCPISGRLGVWTPDRERRPRTWSATRFLSDDPAACPFCDPAPDDPRLLAPSAQRGREDWFALRNLYPPLAGVTGVATLAVSASHAPTLAHPGPHLEDAWAAQLDVQMQLAHAERRSWRLLTTAVGVSAGASQHHPHGQVLVPTTVPPIIVSAQQRWQRSENVAEVLTDAATVASRDGVRLVAPPVPLGPLDLWLVPEGPRPLDALEPDLAARLLVHWIRGVLAVLPEAAVPGVPPSAPPFDLKVLLHAELPDGTGRWWAELQVTSQQAPSVAAAPIVDVVLPRERHAERLRAGGS
ncbi:MAG: hypothetical protein WD638_13155 [Nitriliruptoraceae bacterium]